jgi:hypothetical protein
MDRFVGLGRGWVLDIPPGSDGGRSSKLSFSEGSTGGEEAIRLQSQELGPRRPDSAWRRAESAISKHRGDGRGQDIDPELQELPSDPEVAPFSRASRRIRCLIEGSSEGRRGRREPRPLLLFSRSRCHLDSVSGPTRKLFQRCRDRTRAAAARKARSAVVKRTRLPPRRRTLSWWRSTTVSRSSSSRPQRTSRRSSQHRSGTGWTTASGQV